MKSKTACRLAARSRKFSKNFHRGCYNIGRDLSCSKYCVHCAPFKNYELSVEHGWTAKCICIVWFDHLQTRVANHFNWLDYCFCDHFLELAPNMGCNSIDHGDISNRRQATWYCDVVNLFPYYERYLNMWSVSFIAAIICVYLCLAYLTSYLSCEDQQKKLD